MKRATAAFLALAVLGVVPIAPVGQASAAPAPAWSIISNPYPTNFAAGSSYAPGGPYYQVVATNVGGAPTEGTFTITDTLPGSLKPAAAKAPFGVYGHMVKETQPKLSCSTSGRKVTCTGHSVPLKPGELASPVHPGEQVVLNVPVEVEASAPPLVVNKASIEGGGAGARQTSVVTRISDEPAPFELLQGPSGLYGSSTAADGSTPTQAGSHPYQQTVAGMSFPLEPPGPGSGVPPPAGGGVRDVVAELPPGMVVNPGATPVRCTEAQLEQPAGLGGCPDASQVGVVGLNLSITEVVGVALRPVYNMNPPPGYPAALGFEVLEGTYAHVLGSVSSDGRFQLSAASNDILAKVGISGLAVSLWGDPSDPSHDKLRGACAYAEPPAGGCHVENPNHKAFLTMPSSCGGPLTTTVHVDSWADPQTVLTRSYESTDLEGNPVGVEGCNALEFTPSIASKPTTDQGDSPSGLDFDLHQPQHEGFEELATANLKDTKVTLPEGMVLNPSAAGGREACSSSQIGLATDVGASPIRFREEPQHCPDAAKVGTVEVSTPLLDHKLTGSVYLAKPFDNPFGTLLAIYLAVEDEESGVIAKFAGRVEADKGTGQLTTTVSEGPELPLEDVELHLFGGARAALTTPLACGTHTTTSTLTPWSTPEGADAHPADSFATTGSCSPSEAAAPKSIALTAGTVDPLAGAYSPFVLKLSRPDGSQRITAVDTTLPQGLVGNLAGLPYCSESQIAQAQARNHPGDGATEQASPSCPAASQVGVVNVGAGSGPSPYYAQGSAYLAGPYKGAPLSLEIITPAVAGPFDLGVVAVRVALHVNLETAQIHAVSDPLPTILEGIPLDVRSVALEMNRPRFTLNPTDCEPSAVDVQVETAAGQTATASNRFQVGGCDKLGFKPKLRISLKGGTSRSAHPALKAELTMPPGANVASAQVGLPRSEFIDQGNLDKVCVQADLKAGTCSPRSVYGKAKAWSPLLDQPLEGPVYLGAGYGHTLPDLVADLNGQIRILLHGKVDTTKQNGLRNTFEVVPDAPVSRFVLEMKGGKKYGLLENSESLCRKPQRASVRFVAQNGKVAQLRPRLVTSCKQAKKRRAKHQKARR